MNNNSGSSCQSQARGVQFLVINIYKMYNLVTLGELLIGQLLDGSIWLTAPWRSR